MAVWAVKMYDEVKGRRSIPKVLSMFNDEDESVSITIYISYSYFEFM